MPKLDGEALLKRLPAVRGRLEANAPLADLTWFRAGGPAEVLFTPPTRPILRISCAAMPKDIPVYVIGVGSNLLVRDGGVPGVVIRLGRGFSEIKVEAGQPRARRRRGARTCARRALPMTTVSMG